MEKLPLGSGGKFTEKRREATIPALEIKNTVIWKNPAFPELPFKIQLGKQTPLGVFFTPDPAEYPDEPVRAPAVMPEDTRGRSGLMGSAVFCDREGHVWRDIDVKGIGHFETRGKKVLPISAKGSMGDSRKYLGLCDYEFAQRDRNYSEKFLKAGIRTHRVVAIIDLEELIDETGRKISIDEATKRGVIGEDMHPVVQVRAFGTKERIEYLNVFNNPDRTRPRAALQDAKALVAQELGIPRNTFSNDAYLRWFAKTLGAQVAKIRKLRLYHEFITPHNITLDCRIVDLDSVAPVQEHLVTDDRTVEDLYESDQENAKNSLETLLYQSGALSGSVGVTCSVLNSLFTRSYNAELSRQRPKQQPATTQKDKTGGKRGGARR